MLPTEDHPMGMGQESLHDSSIPGPNPSVAMHTLESMLHERQSEAAYSPPIHRPRIPYLPGPTLEDESRALAAQKKGSIPTKKNALRPCSPVVLSPVTGMNIDRDKIYEQHPVRESPYKITPQPAPRRPFLEAWRARMGLDVSANTGVDTPSKGGLLPTAVLDYIIVSMLLDAPPKTRPRCTLKGFALASKRFRNVAAPHIYQHVILRGNGDAGVYARTGNSKHVRSLTIQFEPHDPWNPYSVLMDQMLYPTRVHSPDQVQETGTEYFFPNLTQIALAARFAPDEARIMWFASSQIFGPEFGTGNFGPPNRAKLYESPGLLAAKLVELVPPKVKTVRLDADISELVAKFVITFVTRPGDTKGEFAIHSHALESTDPAPARTTIIMYGPSYGTSIICGGMGLAGPLQTVWNRFKRPEKQSRPEEVLPPTWEELGPGPRRSTRKSTSPYKTKPDEDSSSPTGKRGKLTAMVKSTRQMPMYAQSRVHPRGPSPEPEGALVPEIPKEPEPTPESTDVSFGQRCAWTAGNTLAQFPETIASAFKQVNDSFAQSTGNTPSAERIQFEGEDAEYPEFWRFVRNMTGSQSHVGVWHTTARTEVDTFITAYREKRFGANMEALKLQILDDSSNDVVVVERGVEPADPEKAMPGRNVANSSAAGSSSAGSSNRNSSMSSGSKGRAAKRVRIA
ncbi:unnamed protein product [Rhizoctonia solani]|uniref:Uncharacterized protein n=1 Tax=Rhizoctonia solani TaxID=456999 RepID=A0A8H3C3E4_9AGAM|nr:unnamed protein product [Rhizoctonia solani]